MNCTYHGDYNRPENWDGACVAQAEVPEGCPVYFVAPDGLPPDAFVPPLPDGVTGHVEVDSSFEASIATIDVYSCDCAAISATVPFDRYTLTLAGAREHDLIQFASSAEESTVAIGAPGPCPGPLWPETFSQATACDLCPVDPADPTDPGTGPTMDPAGCMSASGHQSLATLTLVLGASLGFRRARRRAARRRRSPGRRPG